jgi:hypothetical protein
MNTKEILKSLKTNIEVEKIDIDAVGLEKAIDIATNKFVCLSGIRQASGLCCRRAAKIIFEKELFKIN